MRPSPMIAHSGDVSTVKRTSAVSVALASAAVGRERHVVVAGDRIARRA